MFFSFLCNCFFFFFQAEDGIRDRDVTGVQTCALPIFLGQVGPGAAIGHDARASVGGIVRLTQSPIRINDRLAPDPLKRLRAALEQPNPPIDARRQLPDEPVLTVRCDGDQMRDLGKTSDRRLGPSHRHHRKNEVAVRLNGGTLADPLAAFRCSGVLGVRVARGIGCCGGRAATARIASSFEIDRTVVATFGAALIAHFTPRASVVGLRRPSIAGLRRRASRAPREEGEAKTEGTVERPTSCYSARPAARLRSWSASSRYSHLGL